jgi:solute carrier family 13 (sodium-dependent dicarboxylate transporter), member 2/3/5
LILTKRNYIGLILGPFLFLVVFIGLVPTTGLGEEGRAVLACALWIATWWMTEAVPLAAASLLPIVLLPLTGGAPIDQTTEAYGDKMLFLFVGGFILAIAMQKWGLHKRIALEIISAVGTQTATLVLGFMLATAFLSMWISNTATTLMMVTIASALILQTKDYLNGHGEKFFKALLLSIAFSSSIGGVATLIGTPTNPIFVAMVADMYGKEFSFLGWMAFGVPFAMLMLAVLWILMTWLFDLRTIKLPMGRELIDQELKSLGKIGKEERTILIVFGLTALAWITRSFLISPFIPGVSDTGIAITAALSLFLLRSSEGKPLIDWPEAERLPWGIIILFGGGLSLAAAFKSSGLAEWLGQYLVQAGGLPILLLIFIVALAVNFLTEVTSNVATASIVLPVLASLADALGIDPYLLMIPATMAASCAFMLPVATAPNAIVFSSGHLKVTDMIRAGVLLNLISTLVISVLIYLIFG